MEVNGYLTTVLVVLMLASAFVTLRIPTDIGPNDFGVESAEELAQVEATFMRRRAYFAMTTLLMTGAAIASWQGNGAWTAGLGGASMASIVVYALGLHRVL